MSIDKLQHEINAISRHLTDNPPRSGNAAPSDGMKNVPARQMWEQIQQIENVMLPKIEAKSGKESANYQFYLHLLESLLWAMHILDRYEFLQTRYLSKSMEAAFQKDLNIKYERELQKYTTLEDLMFSVSLDNYNQSLHNRAEALKKEKQL